jgi:hypothetical protein
MTPLRTMPDPLANRPSPSVPASALASLLAWMAGLLRGLIRLALAVSAFMLLMAALFLGLLLALGLVAWALLRGRRPARGVFKGSFQRARARTARPQGEVIDVEVREVPDSGRPGGKT